MVGHLKSSAYVNLYGSEYWKENWPDGSRKTRFAPVWPAIGLDFYVGFLPGLTAIL